MGEPETISERIESVRRRIEAACGRAGRDAGAVRLLVVSKTRPPEAVAEAAAAGQTVFGENRVQEAAAKIPLCPGRLEWHLVGHLQSNKVNPAVRLFAMIHSVHSLERLRQVDAACARAGIGMPVCLQVNVSGEASKSGMPPEELVPTLEAATELTSVTVAGLMTIPPLTPDPERARGFFQTLRALRDRACAATGFPLEELSMGMSHDLEVAVEEGATWVRVGTDVFGPRGGNRAAGGA